MLRETRIWSVVPPGFQKVSETSRRLLVLREDRAGEILAAIRFHEDGRTTATRHMGRAPLRGVRLGNGDALLVRNYHHGGVFRYLSRDWFCTWPPRPFRELAITEELRRRGLATVEVYAAVVERLWGPFYRGCLMTRELQDATELWGLLQEQAGATAKVDAALRATAAAVRTMHRHGVFHSDLNLKNILIRPSGSDMEAYVIDFDKAKLFLGELPPALAAKNLKRLLRSALKLDPQRRYLTAASWQRLLELYHARAD